MSLITVVTIGRNNLAGMKRTFASLVAQTFGDVQHVIIDGGSVDGTAEWAQAHLVFSDSVVVSEADDGIYDAMNKGVAMAEGMIVCFLNSGDTFAAADVLEVAAESYVADKWKWAIGLSMMVDEFFVPVRRQQQRHSYSWWRTTFWNYNISHQATFMETAVVRQLNGFDRRYSVAADYHLSVRFGRLYEPKVWPSTVALTLHGGVSLENPAAATYWQCHSARVDILEMDAFLASLDAVWTLVLIGRAHLRGVLRQYFGGASRRATASMAASGIIVRSGSASDTADTVFPHVPRGQGGNGR